MKRYLVGFSLMMLAFNLQFVNGQSKWSKLFNDKDFKGWKQLGGKALYKVDKGEVVGITTSIMFHALVNIVCRMSLISTEVLGLGSCLLEILGILQPGNQRFLRRAKALPFSRLIWLWRVKQQRPTPSCSVAEMRTATISMKSGCSELTTEQSPNRINLGLAPETARCRAVPVRVAKV